MRNAGPGSGQKLQFVIVKVDAVRIPHVRADPAARFHILQRPHADGLKREILLVDGLTEVRMEPYAELPGKHGRILEQLRRDAERRTGCQRDLMHGERRGIVEFFDEPLAVRQNRVDVLHQIVGRQTAVAFAAGHAAACGVETDPQCVSRAELLVNEALGACSGEHIMVIHAGRAAVAHQLSDTDERAVIDAVLVQAAPDLI